MKSLSILLVILSLSGNSTFGQNNQISEFDLYGCWTFERSEDGQRSEKSIYKRCEISDSKLAIKSSKISLLAFNESEIERWHPFLCPLTYTDKGTWEFDPSNKIVTIYFGKESIKELKEKHPEYYANFGSPEKLEWTRFRIVKLSENQMEIENTTAKRTFN